MYSRSSFIFGTFCNTLAVMALVMLSACASDLGGPIRPHKFSGPQGIGANPGRYLISIGDKLKITVFGEQNLSGQIEVNSLGNVPMPLIGDVAARGKSIRSFGRAIERKLARGFLKHPKVSVEVLNYRPFFVHGEVRSGGQFKFKNGLRMRDAIAIAGGYSYRADKSYALLIREGTKAEIRVLLPTDMIVMPGDNIRIPERFF